MLYIVATPIGNLEDLSHRAIHVLQECDAILCEDTRRSSILLNRYGIEKPLISYHKFKEREALERILADLEGGRNLALISDAGTPCINDPGLILVQACVERGVEFSVIPGACSVIQALVMSGFDTSRFQFLGFLPRKAGEVLRKALGYPGTTVAFESPERVVETLEAIEALDGERRVAVVREMTKMFEECRRGKPGELAAHFKAHPPKGEIVLCLGEGKGIEEELSLEELVEMLQELHGLSLKEAVLQAARLKGVPKRSVYKQIHSK
ncbi:MAG TPA: 16S rRNA (cytidine(1402)-2'-O)-methyltransferase [Chlamydiales bacterium]|nr:16S rRNA (cytidine(1402)-2'-O)-methyltransferase [Chlamydiales bacterium]